MDNSTTTTNAPETAQQNCPLLKLPTELRLQIYGHAFQHDLDLIRSAPASYDSAKPPHRGVLALLRTCHTLRIECVDAIEPLAGASKDALDAELHLSIAHMESLSTAYVVALASRRAHGMYPGLVALREATHCLRVSLTKIDRVCSLMKRARSTDRSVRAHVGSSEKVNEAGINVAGSGSSASQYHGCCYGRRRALRARVSVHERLRVAIYALAFKDIVDFITPATPKLVGPKPELQGAVALLHTNKKLRVESRRELLTLVNAHRKEVRAIASLRSTEHKTACKLPPGTSDDVKTDTFFACFQAEAIVRVTDFLHRTMLRWGFTHQELMAWTMS